MSCKVFSLILIFCLSVTTGAVEQTAKGIRIGLPKRSSLTKADGTFDYEKASTQTRRTVAKHYQNLLNIQLSLESKGLVEVKTGQIYARFSNDKLNSLPVTFVQQLERFERRQSETLTDPEGDNAEWVGNIAIGTPGKTFVIDFDTGSADLWVTSTSCTSSACASKNKYNINESSTAASQEGKFEIQYGDGSTVSGSIETDTVTVAGVIVTNQFFSPVTTLSNDLESDPIDGVLGMAFPALSNMRHNPFFVTAFNQGAVPLNEFAFKLSAGPGSSVFLGGTDDSLFTGSVEYHTISDDRGYWQIGGASVAVGSTTVMSGFQTIIDSGTTLIYGPTSDVKTFYSNVPGSQFLLQLAGADFYSIPCSSAPFISFSWGGNSWPISSANLNLGTTEDGSPDCISAIAGMDLELGSNIWLLGDSFMKNVYSVFSFSQNAVGFATLS